jgi:hypothetical protein
MKEEPSLSSSKARDQQLSIQLQPMLKTLLIIISMQGEKTG